MPTSKADHLPSARSPRASWRTRACQSSRWRPALAASSTASAPADDVAAGTWRWVGATVRSTTSELIDPRLRLRQRQRVQLPHDVDELLRQSGRLSLVGRLQKRSEAIPHHFEGLSPIPAGNDLRQRRFRRLPGRHSPSLRRVLERPTHGGAPTAVAAQVRRPEVVPVVVTAERLRHDVVDAVRARMTTKPAGVRRGEDRPLPAHPRTARRRVAAHRLATTERGERNGRLGGGFRVTSPEKKTSAVGATWTTCRQQQRQRHQWR